MSSSLRLCATALLLGALTSSALAQTQLAVDITDVTVQQLTNGLRLTIKADGLLEARTFGQWSQTNEEHEFTLHLRNARSSVGTFVDVSRYPVNYLKLETPQEAQEGVGLILTVRLYRSGRIRTVDLDNANWSGQWDWRPTDVAYDLRKSSSGRDLVITVWSDRREILPEEVVPRARQKLPEQLALELDDGRVNVDAVNVPLQRLMKEVASLTGQSIFVSDRIERLCTVHLEGVGVEEFVSVVSAALGLTGNHTDGVWYISDGLPSSLTPYTAGGSRVIKLNYLRAEAAISLLPEFLLRYLRPSASDDAIVAHGPARLLDRIEADLREIDRAPRAVSLQAAMIEASGSQARRVMWSVLRGGTATIDLKPADGSILITHVDEPTRDLVARLQALETTEQLNVSVRPVLLVEEGSHAAIFAGVRQFFQFLRRGEVLDLDSTEAGVRLHVRPHAIGDEVVQAYVSVEVSTIRGSRQPPVVDSREASATLLLRSRDSMVVGGGLVNHSHHRETRGPMPVIPVDEENDSEIVFLIGAEIIHSSGFDAEAELATRRED